MSPALYVISVFGGVTLTALALKRSPSAVAAWKIPKSRKGTGGRIPGKNHKLILQIAKRRKLDITPHDLMFGRKLVK